MSITTSYPFTTSGNYTFGSTVEVTGGNAQLKDQRPANATCHATYTTDINLNWGDGTLTGTGTGSPTITGGKLDLTGGGVKYVSYDSDLNADSQQTITIKFKYTPNYSGSPASQMSFFTISESASVSNNLILLRHQTGGSFQFIVIGASGTIFNDTDFYSWAPTSGVEYEFEVNVDITTGASRVFLDGVQIGSTKTETGTRSANIGILRVGTNNTGADSSDFSIADLIVFDTVQHTANYTPASYALETIYATNNPTVKPSSTINLEGISGFTATTTVAGSDLVKYTIQIAGVEKYWTGSAWATSTGYSQSNTAAEINTNVSTLSADKVAATFVAYLHSEDGITIPQLDSVSITFDYWAGAATAPSRCVVYGYIYDADGSVLANVSVQAKLTGSAVYNTDLLLSTTSILTTSDSAGYWELDLVESASLDEATIKYQFTFTGAGLTLVEEKNVPNEATKNYALLT